MTEEIRMKEINYIENNEIRYCKKCRCELTSTNKHKLCDDCRRKRAAIIRNGLRTFGAATGVVVLSFVAKGKHGGGNKG